MHSCAISLALAVLDAMPPTHMTPQLRRQLSDEARRLFLEAHESPPTTSLPRAFQDMRCHLLIEGQASRHLLVQLVASGNSYMFRHHLEAIGADLLLLMHHGVATKWITYATGDHEALHVFLSELARHDPQSLLADVQQFLDTIASLDVLEIVAASASAELQATTPTRIYRATTPTTAYMFTCDAATGVPISIDAGADTRILVTYYNRLGGVVVLQPPRGVPSDLEHMMASALDAFHATWSPIGQREAQDIVDEVDHDRDGFIGRHDVIDQLCEASYGLETARKTASEMTRLLCGGNPSEEVGYDAFLAFWLVMLADGTRTIDDEASMLEALHQLFHGPQHRVMRV
ncbi:hypothetical protein SDRG_00523 [Saprolegnia diclina VS20]|uniref:Uncharacterized protein n=1 Tax=Saprolegnia diclina (strain VS20) TaxID=1156394 RepID=T0SIM5_SAPDV|nr:hypothetical protein SDRG_00523 [Saprolegnia diclina VS20]EQC42802.1 hypothetical protein SDRG_00523 [Saprolegnia diclina VS20]|eukprot:XP_008604225.1 hypothetical protein SDRG_00523 [Saprolegnia diclina VS20]